MIRLPPDSTFRIQPVAHCLETARRSLGSHTSALRAVQRMPSGLAAIPVDTTGRSHILSYADSFKSTFSSSAVKPQVGRDDFIVPYAPTTQA